MKKTTKLEIPKKELYQLIRKIIEFPDEQICKHSVVCDLLQLFPENLSKEGKEESEETSRFRDLASSVINAEDEKSLSILDWFEGKIYE